MPVDRLIRVARLFDGQRLSGITGEVTVALEGTKIAEVGPATELRERWPDVAVDHYPTGTLTPGLVDAHTHLTMPGDGSAYEPAVNREADVRFAVAAENLRKHIAAGVTTVRDLGSHPDFLDWLPADPGELPRHLRYGVPVTGVRGHMHLFGGGAADAEQAGKVARRNIELGADGIKIAATGGGTSGTVPHEETLTEEQIRAAVSVAHEHGLLSTTHALSNESIRRAVLAGSDGIEHLAFLTADGSSDFDARLAELAIEHGTTFGSTLGCNFHYIRDAEAGQLSAHELDEQRERTSYYISNAGRLRTMGARVAPASDAGWKHTAFGDFATELHLLVLAGYQPVEVLRMATGGNAEYLRLAHEVGFVREGHIADLAVFDGDPTQDIEATRAVRAVYRAGRRVT
jgi:imidazolonepropionase-like amidohydrolase